MGGRVGRQLVFGLSEGLGVGEKGCVAGCQIHMRDSNGNSFRAKDPHVRRTTSEKRGSSWECIHSRHTQHSVYGVRT